MGNQASVAAAAAVVEQEDGRSVEEWMLHSLGEEYEAVCAKDAEVRAFDAGLRKRTERVVHSISSFSSSSSGGSGSTMLSLASLKEVTTSFLEVDEEVVSVIMSYKKDVWASDSLFQLVKDYFDNSSATLELCGQLNACIKRARHSQMPLQLALMNLLAAETASKEQQPPQQSEQQQREIWRRVMVELQRYASAESDQPFGEEVMAALGEVYAKQLALQRRLAAQKAKLDKRLKGVRAWSKVSFILLAAACAAVLICAVVAAAVAVPAVVAAVAAASSAPLEAVGSWFRSLWAKYEAELRERRHLLRGAHLHTSIALAELHTIRVLVLRLHRSSAAIVNSSSNAFTLQEQRQQQLQEQQEQQEEQWSLPLLRLAAQQLRCAQEAFVRDLDELEEHVDKCSKRIRTARLLLLRRIVKKRSKSF